MSKFMYINRESFIYNIETIHFEFRRYYISMYVAGFSTYVRIYRGYIIIIHKYE